MVEQEKIVAALKGINDPELNVDIWTLELVYGVSLEGTKVKVTMTLTSPMCPYGPAIVEDVKQKLGAVDGITAVDVDVTFSPPWQPSQELREMIGVA